VAQRVEAGARAEVRMESRVTSVKKLSESKAVCLGHQNRQSNRHCLFFSFSTLFAVIHPSSAGVLASFTRPWLTSYIHTSHWSTLSPKQGLHRHFPPLNRMNAYVFRFIPNPTHVDTHTLDRPHPLSPRLNPLPPPLNALPPPQKHTLLS
jgi:hypothetical protein